MEIENFISNLKDIYEDADPDTIKPETKFREIEGYSSLIAFLIIGMVDEEYNLTLTGDEIRKSETVDDIYKLLKSKG